MRADSELWLSCVFQALSSVHDWSARPSPAMWRHALDALCATGLFGRGLVSEVRRSQWIPLYGCSAAGPVDDPSGFLGHPIDLSSATIESEVVRRRSAALVTDVPDEPRVLPALRRYSGSRSYVVVPIVVCGSVVGLLHMDQSVDSPEMLVVDRDLAKSFADGLSVIHERMLVEAEMMWERTAVSSLLNHPPRAFVGGLGDVTPDDARRSAGPDGGTATPRTRGSGPSMRDFGLTSREVDVVELMVEGLSNADIAAQLTVAESTVKSHVKHILRKLRVANRAAVVARYTRPELGGLDR